MSTSSKANYKGVRKVGTCHGSWSAKIPTADLWIHL